MKFIFDQLFIHTVKKMSYLIYATTDYDNIEVIVTEHWVKKGIKLIYHEYEDKTLFDWKVDDISAFTYDIFETILSEIKEKNLKCVDPLAP